MWSLAKTRTILLAQHEEIRSEIEIALRACAARPIEQKTLKEALDRLVVFLRRHNATEEDALRNVLPGLDAFGAVRKEVMISDHMTEHKDLHDTLIAAGEGNTPESVARVTAMLDRLLGHMEHEESLFLDAKLFPPAEDEPTEGQ